jgi:hypothetical protein
MPPMRLAGRRETPKAQGQAQIPRFIVCPVCHLRNEVGARFCRDCGLPLGAPRDPVRGTTTRRAELPSERGAGIAAILGLAAIVVIAGIAGFLVFRGFETAVTTAGASATIGPSSGIAGASAGATAEASDASDPPVTDPTAIPTQRSTTSPTEDPGDPTERPTADTLSTRTGWTCDPASIQDPLKGRWRIAQVRWGRQDSFDRLSFDLVRLEGSARRGVIVSMEFLRPGRAASRYDMDTPDSDRALVITFDGPLNLRAAMSERPGLATLASFEARTDADGVVHAVLGIEGDGCARIVANDWRDGSDGTTTAKLVIDVRR